MYQDAVRRLFRNFESSQVPNIISLLAKPLSKTQVVATQVVATQVVATQVVATQGTSTATGPSFIA